MRIGKKKTKSSLNPTLAGVAVAGAVVGAGMVAATNVLRDKKNQKKMKVVLSTVSKRAQNYLEDAQSHLPRAKNEKEGKLVEKTKAPVKKAIKKAEKKSEE